MDIRKRLFIAFLLIMGLSSTEILLLSPFFLLFGPLMGEIICVS